MTPWTWVIEQVHRLGAFPIRTGTIAASWRSHCPKKSDGWFLHAMTGHEAYVKFVFRVPGRPFKQDQLEVKLGLKPLSDTPGLEGYSRDGNRVEVGSTARACSTWSSSSTKRPRSIRRRSASSWHRRSGSYRVGLRPAAAALRGNMPWKKDGEKWHLGEKGFPARPRGEVGPRAAAAGCVKCSARSIPPLEFKWDVRDAVTVRPPGASRFWSRIKTKESEALEIWFVGRRGQASRAEFEAFGPRLSRSKATAPMAAKC